MRLEEEALCAVTGLAACVADEATDETAEDFAVLVTFSVLRSKPGSWMRGKR
jgi:hypothetical protein